jgi:energy-coupling factor transporter ATP-binding protein EcfA2
MKLKKFRVKKFRSVQDSGWIDADDVTALIGTNESGKTNLLVPLWKLNPAKNGEIKPLTDYPRKEYHEIRATETKPVFITAEFDLQDELVEKLVDLTGASRSDVSVASVSRDFDGEYQVAFPEAAPLRVVATSEVKDILSKAHDEISNLTHANAAEEEVKNRIVSSIKDAIDSLKVRGDTLDQSGLTDLHSRLSAIDTAKGSKRSVITPRFGQLTDVIGETITKVTRPHPQDNDEARKLVVESLPPFVYYSNYGNLDSEIYLPHVIKNMERSDLGAKEEAKARTLRVLFEFVKLEPKEILELGKDLPTTPTPPTQTEIDAAAERKKERDVLLQSASAQLTTRFRDWWKQGTYRFRFQADGDHFRIWVSDDLRPEDIELESRSSGLQWFLSFYLIFLVESGEAHSNAILLLDEPGHSLHPLAQRDLSRFFDNLSGTNQLIYTTHSPFMVDPDRLDRVKAVYVDDEGHTRSSPNLRIRESTPSQSRSIYAVHAALGLSASQTLMLGCQTVVVEGASDQMYLATMKNLLIARGLLRPKREYMFPPAGGVKGVRALVSILTGKDDSLPYVVLDSDSAGHALAKHLAGDLYAGSAERLLGIKDFSKIDGSEVEDLVPPSVMAGIVTRFLRSATEDFSDIVIPGKPVVPQIEGFASKHGIALELGWKVELAKIFVGKVLRNPEVIDGQAADQWKALFDRLES